MKKIMILAVLMMGIGQANANEEYPTNTWISPINGMSSIWELHMVKNVVRPVHTVYRCNVLQECWKEFEKVRYLTNNFEYIEKVWMSRMDGRINIIK